MLLKLEILSPKGYLYNGNCHLVTIPTKAGEVGVMYGHEMIMSKLESGKIVIYDENEKPVKEFNIEGSGYAKMQDLDTLLVLLD